MDETELKIEHEAPKLKLVEKAPEPVAPKPVEAAPPAEPIIPAPTLNNETPAPEPQQFVQAEPVPVEKPQKEKKNSKKSIILAGILSAVVLIASIVAVVFVTSVKPTPTATTTSETPTTTTTEEPTPSDEEIAKEDALISDDIKTMVAALDQFQNNNNGKVPADWDIFFENYAPSLGKKYKHEKEACDHMAEYGCKNISDLTWEEDKYKVYIAYNATCQKGNVVAQVSSVRRIAFYTVLRAKYYGHATYVCASNKTWYDYEH